MKIYSSTEYIESPKIGDLKLKVNSMWDFGSRNVCFDTVRGIGGESVIGFDLEECIEVVDEKARHTRWKKAEVTRQIKDQLESDGYTMADKYL